MLRYVIRRTIWVVLVMLLITMITFAIFYLLPTGDPAARFAGKAPTEALKKEVSRQLGLDDPVPVQYYNFVRKVALGDEYGWPGLGFSFETRSPIRPEIFERTVITFQLAAGAAVVWLLVGIPIGIVSALRRRTLTDRFAMGFALFGVSAPVFWLGLVALYIFWEQLHWLPGTGYVPLGDDPATPIIEPCCALADWFAHLILPWCVLALLFAAFYARMVRGNLIETLGEDYIRTARAKGLSERKVIGKHALRSSLTPVVTMFGIDFGTLLGGAIITETVFNIPGLGLYAIDAVRSQNLPVILAVVVFAALFITVLNLIVDVVYAYLDPRVRYS